MLIAMVLLNLLAIAAAAGIWATGQPPPVATSAMALIALVNAVLGASVLVRMRRARPPEERRRHVRLVVEVGATLDGRPCQVQDISLGGARALIDDDSAPAPGEQVRLGLEFHGTRIELRCSVRRRLERGFYTRVGLEFLPGQQQLITELALAMLSVGTAADAAGAEAAEAAGIARAA
jgi:membrane protein implicated in regulation of membrane protease activity